MRLLASLAIVPAYLLLSQRAQAEVINVTPSDNYQKIESAKAGDEVVIAPGTYKYRVHLQAKGTTAQPVVIRAQDPANPPVWDMGSTLVEDASGSYHGGDAGRSCWMIDGAENVTISSIVFTHCRNAGHNSAGIRYLGGSKGILVRDVLFKENDNGLTGGNEDSEIVVEHSEFDHNGNTEAGNPTHNIYIYSGTFTLRYSYVHDSTQGQNLHIRAKKSLIEANWLARAKRYEADFMQDDESPSGPSTQEMLFRGNVVIQNPNAENHGQVLVVSHEGDGEGGTDVVMNLRVISNTFVIALQGSSVIHLPDEEGRKIAEVSNNIFSSGVPTEMENGSDQTFEGTSNWMPNGAEVGDLKGSVFGASAPFKNAASLDFTLAAGSNAIGAADTSVKDLPDHEYFQNETVTKQYRLRATAKDIGAFESTTSGTGTGAFDPPPSGGPSTGGPNNNGGPSSNGNGNANGGTSGGGSNTDDGCSCNTAPSSTLASPALAGIGIAALFARLRRRRAGRTN